MFRMIRSAWALPAVLLLAPGGMAQSFDVPTGEGRPVMTDGLLHSDEWADAERVSLGDGVLLHLKEYGGFVFVGVDCGDLEKPFTVNLFLATPGGDILQLHASAQIGERVLVPGEEDPPWIWGLSPGWYANEVRWDQGMARSLMEEGMGRNEAQRRAFFPHDGFEFQIRRSKFRGDEWLMRVEVRSSPDYDHPLVYPGGTSPETTDGWISLVLNAHPGVAGSR